jgi:hypothetical protein
MPGESLIYLSEIVYKPAGKHLFIQLHHNENTGVEAAIRITEREGGRLINIENNDARSIIFRLDNEIDCN